MRARALDQADITCCIRCIMAQCMCWWCPVLRGSTVPRKGAACPFSHLIGLLLVLLLLLVAGLAPHLTDDLRDLSDLQEQGRQRVLSGGRHCTTLDGKQEQISSTHAEGAVTAKALPHALPHTLKQECMQDCMPVSLAVCTGSQGTALAHALDVVCAHRAVP